MAQTKYHDARDGRVRLNLKPSSLLKADRVDGLGAGDSSLTLNFLPVATADAVFGKLRPPRLIGGATSANSTSGNVEEGNNAAHDGAKQPEAPPSAAHDDDDDDDDEQLQQGCEVVWREMLNHRKPVPRLVCIQGEKAFEGSAIPLYRHPVDEQPPCEDFSPSIQLIVDQARETFGHPFNQALIQVIQLSCFRPFISVVDVLFAASLQLYRSGEDSISSHSDKTLDLDPEAPIVNVSLGCSRLFIIRSKEKAKGAKGSAEVQRVPLLHNSALAFGLETNRRFTHQIDADRRPPDQRRPDETAAGGVRISITLRVVRTYQRIADGRIFGQGAPLKTIEALEGGGHAVEEERGGDEPSSRGMGAVEVEGMSSGPAVDEGPADAAAAAGGGGGEGGGGGGTALRSKEATAEAEAAAAAAAAERARLMEAFRWENKAPDFDWAEAYGSGFGVISPY